MNRISVGTNELKACAATYKNLANAFDANCENLMKKIDEYESFWKGSFSKDFDEKVTKIKKVRKSIVKNSAELAAFIEAAVEKYIQVDQGLAQSSEIGNKDYPGNVIHIRDGDELNKYYSEAVSAASKGTKNVGGGLSCAELTKAKMKLNGFYMERIGNGNQTYANIVSNDRFNAEKYPGGNCLNDLINSTGQPVKDIVISFPYAASEKNRKYGHVIYIDQIVDGKIYYSDNWGETKKGVVCDLNQFFEKYPPKKFGTPIGCTHLTKK